MAPDEEGAVNMDELVRPRARIDEIARSAPGWRRLVDRLHEEAEITDAYDPDLLELIVVYMEEAAKEEIWRLLESEEGRRELILEWQDKKNAAAATAATRA